MPPVAAMALWGRRSHISVGAVVIVDAGPQRRRGDHLVYIVLCHNLLEVYKLTVPDDEPSTGSARLVSLYVS